MKERQVSATFPTYHGYSWGFKVTIVEEIENGRVSINQASKKYGIGRTTIQKWERIRSLRPKIKRIGRKVRYRKHVPQNKWQLWL